MSQKRHIESDQVGYHYEIEDRTHMHVRVDGLQYEDQPEHHVFVCEVEEEADAQSTSRDYIADYSPAEAGRIGLALAIRYGAPKQERLRIGDAVIVSAGDYDVRVEDGFAAIRLSDDVRIETLLRLPMEGARALGLALLRATEEAGE